MALRQLATNKTRWIHILPHRPNTIFSLRQSYQYDRNIIHSTLNASSELTLGHWWPQFTCSEAIYVPFTFLICNSCGTNECRYFSEEFLFMYFFSYLRKWNLRHSFLFHYYFSHHFPAFSQFIYEFPEVKSNTKWEMKNSCADINDIIAWCDSKSRGNDLNSDLLLEKDVCWR